MHDGQVCSPMAGASPDTTLKTPSGRPARSASSARVRAVRGVSSAGLRTTYQEGVAQEWGGGGGRFSSAGLRRAGGGVGGRARGERRRMAGIEERSAQCVCRGGLRSGGCAGGA